MTNTKFRKRALLSSVAMLLVALVALGSATFAWFTENPTVSASGIEAYGQTSSGLEISSTTNTAWAEETTFMTEGGGLKLIPAYAVQDTSDIVWLSAAAANAAASTPTGDWAGGVSVLNAQDNQGNSLGAHVYHEQAFIRAKNIPEGESAPTVNLTALSIEAATSAPAISQGATVLVAVGGQIKAWAKIGSDNILNYASAAANTAVGSASGTYANKFVTGTPVALGTAGTGATGSAVLTVDVYVYLDGTDSQVYTNNVDAAQLVGSVSMSFEKA